MTVTLKHRQQIVDLLSQQEEETSIKVLGAVEAGSRSWGFYSSDSDYDVRFLYRRPIQHYYSLDRALVGDTLTFLRAPYDLHGWDATKAAKLAVCSNPSLYEWVASNISYLTSPSFTSLRALVLKFYSLDTIARSYYHLAVSHRAKYIKHNEPVNIKRLLYITRTLLAQQYIIEHLALPPIELTSLAFLLPDPAYDDLGGVLQQKQAGSELSTAAIPPHLNNYINGRIQFYSPNSLSLPASVHEAAYQAFNTWLIDTIRGD